MESEGTCRHPAVAARLAKLAPDQRRAATAPPGPVLCVAPAGSGKTTTLVARVAWLVDGGVDPATITAITFNKRAAEELRERVGAALEPLGLAADADRIRTFHALGREILADAGVPVEPLHDRGVLLRRILPSSTPAERRRLDDTFSRIKLDLGLTAADVAADPEPGPVARAFIAYEAAIAESGGLDFDDFVARALRTLDGDARLLACWRERCAHLLVDETQDVDRSQLRLALLLAAPANRIFLVGDDDQSIYGWRLADVRRILGLAADLPGLLRIDLETNYRCPAPVLARAVRLVERNEERFVKVIRARPIAPGRLVLAPDDSDDETRTDRILASWPADGSGTRAILARTNRELRPAAAVLLERGVAFRAPALTLLVEDERLDALLATAKALTPDDVPLLLRLARLRERPAREVAVDEDGADDEESVTEAELVEALIAWAPRFADLPALETAVRSARERLALLRSETAPLTLATAHSTKGLEFDHVAVLGLDDVHFPHRRSLQESDDPVRALEEERRLAYVAWTRARRSLALVYDPTAPSPFLLEAFDPQELGISPG